MSPWLAQGAALGFGAAASPGPFQAFLLSRAARGGILRTLPLALAPLASDGPVIAVVVLALARAPAGLLRALQLGGGAFLLWLAWGTVRELRRHSPRENGEVSARDRAPPVPVPAPGGREGARGFLEAALVNALGPGPWLFWSTVGGPALLEAWRAEPARALAFLCGFYLLLLGGNAALVVLFGAASRAGPRVARALGWASAAVMAGLGAVQLWRALSGR